MRKPQDVFAVVAPPHSCYGRLGFIGLFVVATLAFLLARLWQLQIIEGQHLRSLSEQNRLRLKRTPPLRGLIYDRRGQVLVENRPAFDVVVVPEDTPDLSATLSALATYLPGETLVVDGHLPRDPRRPAYAGLVAARDIDWSSLVAVEAHQIDIPGVGVEVSSKRVYPAGGVAAHVLGYVGEVNAREMARLPSYHLGDLVGKVGIEKTREADLRGRSGGQQIEVDAMGRRLRVLEEVEAQAGRSLMLTIDLELQKRVENILGDRVGAVVVLGVQTGEVLAMVSHPTFDPNLFARGIKREEWRQLQNDELHPLTNRAFQGQYPPGSTFKVVMAAAALQEGIITPATRFFCPGGLPFGGRVFHCWKRGGHGSVDLRQAIAQSCDVYFYHVGQRLGIRTIAEYARRFGLGSPLGMRLDFEAGGTIPDPDWKRRRLGAPWYAGETLSVAIGQGYVTVTPLQIASVTATLANGGTVYRPYLVKQVIDTDGKPIREYGSEILAEVGIRPEFLQVVREGMWAVVNSRTGTGKNARLAYLDVAGKTGTAQVIGGRLKGTQVPRRYRDHAWFIAFAPAEVPEVAVSCLIEHAGEGGGKVAAPIVREVLNAYFAITRGYVPEPEHDRQEVHLAF